MKDFGLLSIIVPVYNSEKWLKRCIDSILSQTYKNFELILINDGSTDNSKEILESYRKNDKRIKVYHQENAGQGITRKRGIDLSIGQFITFVDSDDYILPTMYETMLDELSSKRVDICACLWQYETENGYQSVNINQYINESPFLGLFSSSDFAKRLYCDTTYEYTIVAILVNKVYRRHLLNGIMSTGRISEDEEMMDYILQKTKNIYIDEHDFYVWCHHDSSMSHKGFTIEYLHKLDVNYNRYNIYKDSYMRWKSQIRFCDLCIEYYYKVIAIKEKFPVRYKFMMIKSVFHLLQNKHTCGIKFYIRCLIFLISPVLYKQVTKSKNKNAFK